MKYQLESIWAAVNIEATETRGKQSELVQASQECQQGRCYCPTWKHSKPGSLVNESGKDSTALKLASKQLDPMPAAPPLLALGLA